MFSTTIRSLVARRFRLVTTGLAVMLGVAFMAGTLTLTDTVGRSFNRLYANVYAGTDAIVRSSSTTGPSGMQMRGTVPSSLVTTINHVPGVASASGFSQGYAQLLGKDGKVLQTAKSAPSIGFTWITDPRLNPFRIAQGRPPASDDEIVIDRSSARTAGYRLGDQASVLTEAAPRRMRIVGIATFTTADSPAGASAVLFTANAAEHLIGQRGRFDAVAVAAKPGVSQAAVAGRIRHVLPTGTEVLTGSAVTAEAVKSSHQMLAQFNDFLLAFAFISLFVGSFVIYNTFSILVAQRSREHALLRAVGASRRQILVSVITESVAVGAIAAAAGIAVGILIASGLKALLGGFGVTVPAGRLVLSSSTVMVAALTGIGVTVASAVFPARRAAKVAPVAALRDADIEVPTPTIRRAITGGSVTAVGAAFIASGLAGQSRNALKDVSVGGLALFIGVAMLVPLVAAPLSRMLGAPLVRLRGVPGRLGRDNAMRNPKRTAATAASLMIGVALVGFLTVFAASAKRSYNDSVNASIKSNYVVSGGAMEQSGFPPDLARSVARAPGVLLATGDRTTQVAIGSSTKQAAGVDPLAYPRLVDLHVVKGSLQQLRNGGVAVVDTLAASHHWRLGQEVPVRFVATGTKQLTLVAVYTQKVQVAPVVIGLSVFDANVATQLDTTIYVATQPGVASSAARAALDAATAAYPTAKVESRAQYVKDQLGPINTLLGLVYVMLAFAVVVALLGISNTLALSLRERTRELGLLRAVGMARRQLRSAVRSEAAIVAALGTLLGLVLGTGFGYALVRASHNIGIGHFTVPASQLGTIAVIASLSGVLAAGRPARRAARLNVLDAVATR